MKSRTYNIGQNLRSLTLVVMLLAASPVTNVWGQDPTPAAETATPAPAAKELTLLEMVRLGGWTMWFLGICSIAGVSLIVYNGIRVRAIRMLNPAVVSQIAADLGNLDIESAKSHCLASPCMITNIIYAGLERVTENELRLPSIEKGMEEASVEEIGHALVPINYISAAAVTAPMFGLLGTVSGMISAFRGMAVGGMGRPELLADNISEALITTATGLIVGIPCMVAYLFFKNRLTSIIASLNRQLGNLQEILTVAVKRYQADQRSRE